MEGIPGHGDIGEMDGDVSSPWVLVTRKRGNKEDLRRMIMEEDHS
jgi:hypothetical protein